MSTRQRGRDLEHPALGTIRLPAPPLSIGPGSFEPGAFAAPFGSEARAILADFGFSEAEIEAAIAEKIVEIDAVHREIKALNSRPEDPQRY